MNIPDISHLQEAVLYELYIFAADSGGPLASIQVANLFSPPTPTMFAEKVLNILDKGEYIISSDIRLDIGAEKKYEITYQGIKFVQDQLRDPTSMIANYAKEGYGWLVGDLPTITSPGEEQWEPLLIDRESPHFDAAANELENVIEVIEGDNGYADSEPDERNHIVASLRHGLERMREGLPSLQQVRGLILGPLNFVAQKFVGTAMGVASKAAIEKIIQWIATLGS